MLEIDAKNNVRIYTKTLLILSLLIQWYW